MAQPISVHGIKGPKSKKANVKLEIPFPTLSLQHSQSFFWCLDSPTRGASRIMRGSQGGESILTPTH